MGLLQSTPVLSSSISSAGLPGTAGGPPPFQCFPSGQFLCAQKDAQCAALADFYCSTNGWLWAQGAQGKGWSAAAGCYASTPALGCVAPVPPVATDYCTFYGVTCTTGNVITALVFESMGTSATTALPFNNPVSGTAGWGSLIRKLTQEVYSGYYTPYNQTLWTVILPDLDWWTCPQAGLSMQLVQSVQSVSCVGALLNESGIPGPWNCPSYLSGGSNVTSGAWNFSVLDKYAPRAVSPLQALQGANQAAVWTSVPSCTVGLVLSVVSSAGSEQQSCLGCYMYGSLPASIGNLTGLTTLVLNQNLISGSLPDSLGSLTQLIDLEMAGNQLTGSLPSSLTSLSMLVTLDLNSNSIGGVLPESIGNLASNLMTSTTPNRRPRWSPDFNGRRTPATAQPHKR